MGVALTTWEVMDQRAQMLAVLSEIFAEVGSDHTLVGGIAVGYHGRLRATVDVDVLVPQRKIGRIQKALVARGYVVTRHPGMIRVYEPGADPKEAEAIADLVEREANPVLRAAALTGEDALVLGQPVKVVARGALVALKFHAAVSRSRRVEDRYQDVADLGRIVRKAFSPEDETLALDIAEHSYPGARKDLQEMLADLRADKPVRL
jgi:hypothetical protein